MGIFDSIKEKLGKKPQSETQQPFGPASPPPTRPGAEAQLASSLESSPAHIENLQEAGREFNPLGNPVTPEVNSPAPAAPAPPQAEYQAPPKADELRRTAQGQTPEATAENKMTEVNKAAGSAPPTQEIPTATATPSETQFPNVPPPGSEPVAATTQPVESSKSAAAGGGTSGQTS